MSEELWFHRGPCCRCRICGGTECYVFNDNVSPAVHICAGGCDVPLSEVAA